ncbi:ABC transporter ATP-binding protein [Schaalia sp. 19OD2882]|uniref:ABC transporter ATP-binding protein n=1 Tax=Schaalia sp. 19OD2882 TaxID=2794089 RepID=UPI001C1EE5A2|nr:ABC transporter ATP-binding protein [Schaalia sp. 19OD2882]QWW19665.1 ABC transporter ATP-binding protein [Schaalia sp. 19OD2882]
MTTTQSPVFRIEDLSVAYGQTLALDSISIDVPHGAMNGLVGPNGSGKTTLLRTMYRGLSPTRGHVLLNDRPLAALRPHEISREISVVVQQSFIPHRMSVLDEVLLGRMPFLSDFCPYDDQDRALALEALEAVGMLDKRDRRSDELSGGERQRVVIARALAQGSRCILLDEPTNHLDVRYQHEVLSLLRGLGRTVIVVLHDLNMAARYCDRIHVLDAGRLCAVGTAEDVLVEDTIAELYGVAVSRIEHCGKPQFLFTSTTR